MLDNKILFVGICGKAGAGKDTFCEPFHDVGFRQLAFAAPLKWACMDLFRLSSLHFNNRDLKESKVAWLNKSPRELAQWLGTEIMREQFGEDFWIRRLAQTVEAIAAEDVSREQTTKIVISDVRFQNEAQFILDAGGKLVLLTRPDNEGTVGIPSHRSEAGINFDSLTNCVKGENFNRVLNAGSIEQLHHTARYYIQHMLSI